jgi:hypothetical protein
MVNPATDQLAAISRLFSSSVVHEMARKGKSPLFARLVTQSQVLCSMSLSESVYTVFEAAFSLLKREGYRHEYIYKAALTHKILLGKHSLQTASMIHEFRVGDCKADVAILNGTATVYEVKSERDSLTRLERQIAAYATVFAGLCHRSGMPYPRRGHTSRRGTLSQPSSDFDLAGPADQRAYVAWRDLRSIRTEEARMILSSFGVSVPLVRIT